MSIALHTESVTAAAAATPFIVRLAGAADVQGTGGKAVNLARLIAAGASVPDGFVVTNAALQHFLDVAELRPSIVAACGRIETRSALAMRCASDTIAALIEHEPLPAALGDVLEERWHELSSTPAIIRSSAIGEDGDTASFAGQLDSVADVTNVMGLRQALARVWASQWSARVLAYQVARHASLDGMGVIVQRQVDAALSGVLFTVAPDTPSHMLVEYCAGMGEALVSGAVNPGRVSLARRDFRWSRQAAPDHDVPDEASLLNDPRIAAMGRLGLEIERTFGRPQDIEWTMDRNGKIWIVQARPITTHARGTSHVAPGPLHVTAGPLHVTAGPSHVAPGPSDVSWSNANVSENFPQPICPLLYSVARVGYYHYFRNLGRAFGVSARRLALMEPALRQIIGVHGARMYYNLTSIHEVLRSAPFGELLTASFNQFVGADDVPAGPGGSTFASRARGRVAQVAELVVIAARTTWQFLFLTKRVERFEQTVDAFAARTHPTRLHAKSAGELLVDLRSFMDIRCNRWKDASLADAGSMVCYGMLQRLLAQSFPGDDQQALHNTLLKALPDLVSSMPPLRLWKLSRMIRADEHLHRLVNTAPPADVLEIVGGTPQCAPFRDGLDEFLEHWGFRCSAELMLTVPSFQEDPTPVIALLKAYAAMDGESPADLLSRQASERIQDTGRVLSALRGRPVSRWLPFLRQSHVVGTVLRWTQRSIQLRERARLKQALLYSRLRRVVLALGDRVAGSGRIAQPDDLFFLTAQEIDLLVAGGAMFPDHVRPLIALRRQAHAEVSAMAPPDSMRLGAGEYLPTAAGVAAPEGPDSSALARLHGIGACGGSTTGRAAILLDVTDSERLGAGDILVTRQTDPGWGPIFPLISGLVVERGGMLSHGAIIAREFGIPSVVGVKDATRLIPHGGRITVDGDRGLVQVGVGDS